MKILVLAMDFYPNPGGIAVFVHNLCFQLSKQGHKVDVLAPYYGGRKNNGLTDLYKIFRYLPFSRLSFFVPFIKTIFLYWKNRYDIFFLGRFTTTHALGVLILHIICGVPYIILSHGNDLRYTTSTRVDKIVAKLLMRNAAVMLGNSCFVVDCIKKRGYKGCVKVLNPGVDIRQFHPGVNTHRIIEKHGLNGRKILLCTARLTAKKNIEGILKALPKITSKIPNVLCLIIGDGEKKYELEILCDKLGLQSYVSFLGHIEHSHLPAWYCVSDLFVMPSCETFGISFIEANACGKPVIGGRSGGITDAVVDGETGILVDPHNINEIAAAVIQLLTDQKTAYRLGKNGRQRVEQEFSWEMVGKKFEKILVRI